VIIYRNLVEEKREYVSQLDSPDTRDDIHDMSSYTDDLNARQFKKKCKHTFTVLHSNQMLSCIT
jgi:hypothetical protein